MQWFFSVPQTRQTDEGGNLISACPNWSILVWSISGPLMQAGASPINQLDQGI